MPALVISRWRRSCSRDTVSASARTCARDAKSARWKRAEPPCPQISRTTSSPRRASRPWIKTRNPEAASRVATARPRPSVEPVIKAVFCTVVTIRSLPDGDPRCTLDRSAVARGRTMRQRMPDVSNRSAVLALVAGLIAASALAFANHSGRSRPALRQAAAGSRLTLRSPDVTQGTPIALAHVYDRSGCHGGNISPALSWDHPPAGTRSFAVLMFDPDAPGNGWWHWAVFDIPADVTSLPA